jgi:hypothetical protein
MSKFYKLLIISGFLFAGLIVFQNCSSHGGGGGAGPGNVVTTSALAISPTSGTVSPLNNLLFSATGGTPPYTFLVMSGFGTITQAGLFTADSSTGLTTVAVRDAAGSMMLAYVTVGSSSTGGSSVLTLVPSSAIVAPGGTVQLRGTNGTAPYSYSMHAGDGSVNSTGLFTAASSVGNSIVMVSDNTGTKAYSYITISAGTGTTYTTTSGNNQVCCPSGMTATSFTDIGTGHNHGINANSPTANCCTAWEGSGNYGAPGCQITCN